MEYTRWENNSDNIKEKSQQRKNKGIMNKSKFDYEKLSKNSTKFLAISPMIYVFTCRVQNGMY